MAKLYFLQLTHRERGKMSVSRTRRVILALAASIACIPAYAFCADPGLYELRVYTPAPGKAQALHARFRDHTLRLFARHGMTNIGYFTAAPVAGQPADERLFYILGFPDRAARDAAFKAFGADPEWRAVFEASQAAGALTTNIASTFLTPAEYAPAFASDPAAVPRLFELRTYRAAPGKLENVHARFRDHTRDLFAKHGMTSIAYWRPVAGQPQMDDRMVYLLAFPSAEARAASFHAFGADPEWRKAAADSEAGGPILAQPGAIVSVQLVPTDYSPLR